MAVSCNKLSRTIEKTLNPDKNQQSENSIYNSDPKMEDTSIKKAEIPFCENIKALEAAEASLRNMPQFKGKNINIYRSVHFYEDYRISMKIQHPDNPEYIDEYYYADGKWNEPKPVQTTKRDKIEENLLTLDKIPFVNAHNVYRSLQEKIREIPDVEKIPTIYVIAHNGNPRWYPSSIDSPRSKYSIEFNTDGTLKFFEKE